MTSPARSATLGRDISQGATRRATNRHTDRRRNNTRPPKCQIGQAQYDGEVRFHVASSGIEFDFAYPFSGTANIDSMVNGAAQILVKRLNEMADAVRDFSPGA
jgi:hypothetical protein